MQASALSTVLAGIHSMVADLLHFRHVLFFAVSGGSCNVPVHWREATIGYLASQATLAQVRRTLHGPSCFAQRIGTETQPCTRSIQADVALHMDFMGI